MWVGQYIVIWVEINLANTMRNIMLQAFNCVRNAHFWFKSAFTIGWVLRCRNGSLLLMCVIESLRQLWSLCVVNCCKGMIWCEDVMQLWVFSRSSNVIFGLIWLRRFLSCYQMDIVQVNYALIELGLIEESPLFCWGHNLACV